MKNKTIQAILIIVLGVNLNTNAQHENREQYDLKLILGAQYYFFDNIGGPALGLILISPENRYSFDFRYSIAFKIGRSQISSNSQFINYENKFGITGYQNRMYLGANYRFSQVNDRFSAGLGLGWVYSGEDEKYLLNEKSGYYTASLNLRYKISWITIEPRYDFNISGSGDPGLSPFSISLVYLLRPN